MKVNSNPSSTQKVIVLLNAKQTSNRRHYLNSNLNHKLHAKLKLITNSISNTNLQSSSNTKCKPNPISTFNLTITLIWI